MLVEGRLRPDLDTGGPHTFVRHDGSPGAACKVTVETIKLLGSAPGNNGSQAETVVPIDEETIPF